MVSYEQARTLVIILSWIIGGYLIVLWDGILLHIRGIKLFSQDYEDLCRWEKIYFNVTQVSFISFCVCGFFGLVYYLKYIK